MLEQQKHTEIIEKNFACAVIIQEHNSSNNKSSSSINIFLNVHIVRKVQIVSHYLFVTYLDVYVCLLSIQTKRKRRNDVFVCVCVFLLQNEVY